MADETDDELDTGWLLEPPANDRIHLYVAVGPEVELSDEARSALERLMSALQEEEVSGFDFSEMAAFKCPAQRKCTPYGVCTLYKTPNCYVLVSCQIAGT